MVFSTQSFLFLFLPVFLGIYFLIPCRKDPGYRNIWVLVSSLILYGWYDWKVLPLLPGVTFVCWAAGRYLEKGGRYRKSAVTAAAALSAGILLACKYMAAEAGKGGSPSWMGDFVLPLGISFYTFQALSYTFDAYSGKNGRYASPDYISFLTGTAMFAQLASGPVIRWHSFAPQLKNRVHSWKNFSEGALLFMSGFAKKILIADELGRIADPVFAAEAPETAAAWLGITAYTMQIYFDFSGYCSMGMGAAKMTGFILPANFKSPYRRYSVRGFWRHWNITLSRWFRDYVYIPLGGNRKGRLRTICSIFAVMLMSGIWHGTGWNFVIFGMIHAAALTAEHIAGYIVPEMKVRKAAGWMWMMMIITVSFVFFRTSSPEHAAGFISSLAGMGKNNGGVQILNMILTWKSAAVMITAIFIAVFVRINAEAAARKGKSIYYGAITSLFVISIAKMLAGSGKEFIYFVF